MLSPTSNEFDIRISPVNNSLVLKSEKDNTSSLIDPDASDDYANYREEQTEKGPRSKPDWVFVSLFST